MSKLTIAVDLAKDIFEIAVANQNGRILERKRLTRPQFERFWQRREPCAVVMEACGATATALYASVGNIHLFKSGRHLASWLGITPKEHSSGSTRRMGRISKQGDPYLRTLLIHGARSALTAAQVRQQRGKPLTRLQQWAVQKAGEVRHSNQAAVALANKVARICWAVWKHQRHFDGNYLPQVA